MTQKAESPAETVTQNHEAASATFSELSEELSELKQFEALERELGVSPVDEGAPQGYR
jgi:hypothetical protein